MIATFKSFEKVFDKELSIECNFNNGSKFEFDGNSPLRPNKEWCKINPKDNTSEIILKGKKNELTILDSKFNISSIIDYIDYFDWRVILSINNLKGFDINLLGSNVSDSFIHHMRNSWIKWIGLVNSEINFYIGKEKTKLCQNFNDTNISQIDSIFQIACLNRSLTVWMINCEYKEKLCPLAVSTSVHEFTYR